MHAYRHSRAIAIGSSLWPGRTMQAGLHQRQTTRPSRSGIQRQANASRHSRAIAIGSTLWPGRTMRAGLRRRRSDKTVKIWDPATGQCISTLEGHSDSVYSVAWSHDASRLASASAMRPSRSGIRRQANASRHSRAIAIRSILWPGRTMQAGSRRHQATRPLRSGIRRQANVSRHSRAIVIWSTLWPGRTMQAGLLRR